MTLCFAVLATLLSATARADVPREQAAPPRIQVGKPTIAPAKPPRLVSATPNIALSPSPAHAPAGRTIPTIFRRIRDVGLQAGGLTAGAVEKLLGNHDPTLTGPFRPLEVKPPTKAAIAEGASAPPPRSLLVYRSNQPKTVDDIASFVDIAKQRGVTDRSQIAFINLRSEREQDVPLVEQYERQNPDPAHGAIKTVDVKILDNAPPAFYVGNAGWNHAVDKIRQVYTALKDPNVKIAVIHCEQGHGRTGEVVAAAVRVALDGMSGEQALAEAEKNGLKMPWQKDFILRFAREWRAGRISFDAGQGATPAPAITPAP
jgi:hypothetical protein